MKNDEIIQNPYYLVAGILLMLISLVLVGFALAIGDIGGYPHEVFDRDFIGYPFQAGNENPELKQIEDDFVEFVAECGCEEFDTAQGTIEIENYYVDDYLPLCLTQSVLDKYWVTVKITGGYEPLGGYIYLDQKNEFKGKVLIEWANTDDNPCDCVDYWTASFKLKDESCPIALDSNQWPAGAVPVEDNCKIPGKEVLASWCTLWTGCDHQDQQFRLIQTQKINRPLDDPNSHEIIISSPV
jgi:hypothetical protein